MKNLTYLFALLFLGTFAVSCENEDNTAELYELEIQDEINAGGGNTGQDSGGDPDDLP